MKIIADRDIPFLRGVLEPFAEVVYLPGDAIGPDDIRDTDALLVRTRTCCDSELLTRSRVRFIGTATIGFDHIDTDWCRRQGIRVATAAGCNSRGVLQWVAAALTWLAGSEGFNPRRKENSAIIVPSVLTDGCAQTSSPDFSPISDFPSEITLGVVGVGNVGSLVKEYAESWGFRVMCSDPPRERAEGLGPAEGFYPLPTLAAECDIVTFHVPLTATGPDATRHMVDEGFLTAAKPGAVILNSSRGPVIDPDALRKAVGLKPVKEEEVCVHPSAKADGNEDIETSYSIEPKFSELLPSVLTDGYTSTPLTGFSPTKFIIDTWNDEPRIDREVLQRALLGTPHIAGYSVQGKAAAAAMIVGALAREFGLPLRDWYPAGAPRSMLRTIGWEEMCRTMPARFDIAAESAALKAAPELFETMRNDYKYRQEYF